MSKLFSVIIPCYNAAELVDTALGSVIGQTLDRSMYEVIAVDDASTDDTLTHLNRWAQRFPETVRVITYNTNLRQGGARNRAIKEAEGDYICFLDADDWMEADALCSFRIGTGSGYDIVTALFKENSEHSGQDNTSGDQREAGIQKVFGGPDIREYISYDLGFVWSSVYRRSMIINNDIWFPEHLAYEDIYWQRLVKFYIGSACIIDKVTHHYYNNPGSTMNRRNAPYHIDRLTSYEALLSQYLRRGLLNLYYREIMNDTFEVYLYNSYFMFFTMMDEIPDVYARIRETIYKYFPDWETAYDDTEIPVVFRYMLKYMKKARKATPEELMPFKETILEIISEEDQK